MDELKVDQVKILFEEAFCAGCEVAVLKCYKCPIGKGKENFYRMMESIAIINDLDKILNPNEEVDSGT
jgi:hypothetical protein